MSIEKSGKPRKITAQCNIINMIKAQVLASSCKNIHASLPKKNILRLLTAIFLVSNLACQCFFEGIVGNCFAITFKALLSYAVIFRVHSLDLYFRAE